VWEDRAAGVSEAASSAFAACSVSTSASPWAEDMGTPGRLKIGSAQASTLAKMFDLA